MSRSSINRLGVSTHSRLKAAGRHGMGISKQKRVSTHSRLKAAGAPCSSKFAGRSVSTHSRLKAAGPAFAFNSWFCAGFNTQPPEGGWNTGGSYEGYPFGFQHTAA